MKGKKIRLIGYHLNCDHPQFNCPVSDNDESALTINSKLRRFYSKGTEKCLISTRRLLLSSSLNIDDPAIKFGLYATQYGYLHPMPGELLPEWEQNGVRNEQDIYQAIWASEQVNPFLITLSLSNNLLGVLSQELALQGDCASFLRGNIGLLSAFNEAELLLNNGVIDYALVVASGMGQIDRIAQSDISETFVEFGVTFILTRDDKPMQKDCPIVDIASLSRMYHEGNYSAETLDFINDIAEAISSSALIENFN
ncbi:hypothetical protein [Xenorhabdus anantnagensis]|uniref:Beta-ketoacyl synthase N-terminal domain-containing protein n=1 Tax=Xenorhabdus anantnagensis TaxID=3025875 RepID=A0ABT5LS93_9GAMM|nr:hypothetical protein [Xenorhabdus anantnagensis]MDC9597287.1 hypothetical protein [Xenorhabdus anantnagensis]